MQVIGHEHVRVYQDAVVSGRSVEAFPEEAQIAVSAKYRLAIVAPLNYVER
jgi:hypothetical protein